MHGFFSILYLKEHLIYSDLVGLICLRHDDHAERLCRRRMWKSLAKIAFAALGLKDLKKVAAKIAARRSLPAACRRQYWSYA